MKPLPEKIMQLDCGLVWLGGVGFCLFALRPPSRSAVQVALKLFAILSQSRTYYDCWCEPPSLAHLDFRIPEAVKIPCAGLNKFQGKVL